MTNPKKVLRNILGDKTSKNIIIRRPIKWVECKNCKGKGCEECNPLLHGKVAEYDEDK